VHTVVETPAYLAAAKDSGMTDDERRAIVDRIAENPIAGDVMPGTGGCRKVRSARRGKGRSGGYRVITAYGGSDIPVFLLTVFAKGEKANLTKAECNELKKLTKAIVESYRWRINQIRWSQ
jgi:hypothetical protein